MEGLGCAAPRSLDEELERVVAAAEERLDVEGEDGLVELVGAKGAAEEEGTAATKEAAHPAHTHEVWGGGGDRHDIIL